MESQRSCFPDAKPVCSKSLQSLVQLQSEETERTQHSATIESPACTHHKCMQLFFWKCFDSGNGCQFAGLRCNRKRWKHGTVIRCSQSQGVCMFCIPLDKDDAGTNRDECVTVANLCAWNPCVFVLGPLGLKKDCNPLHKHWSNFQPQGSFSLGGSDFGPKVDRFLGFQVQ